MHYEKPFFFLHYREKVHSLGGDAMIEFLVVVAESSCTDILFSFYKLCKSRFLDAFMYIIFLQQ